MPYVHLSNGDVKRVTTKELVANNEQSGSPHVWRENGLEHPVIGVYPEEYEHPKSEEERAVEAAKEAEDRAAFDAWRATQHNFEGRPL